MREFFYGFYIKITGKSFSENGFAIGGIRYNSIRNKRTLSQTVVPCHDIPGIPFTVSTEPCVEDKDLGRSYLTVLCWRKEERTQTVELSFLTVQLSTDSFHQSDSRIPATSSPSSLYRLPHSSLRLHPVTGLHLSPESSHHCVRPLCLSPPPNPTSPHHRQHVRIQWQVEPHQYRGI